MAPGSYAITLTVTDNYGQTATKQITETYLAPTASFTTSFASSGQGLTYDATGSTDPNAGGALVSYQWNFGDGTTATGATVTHRFVAPGDYTVSLTVTDNIGLSATTTESFFRHDSPTIVFGSIPSFVTVGTPISFDGSRSTDPTPGSTITGYSWDIGDGSSASGPMATHAYDKPGTYAIALMVSDSRGLQSAVIQRITVIGVPQARIALSPRHPASGLAVHFDASGSTDSGAAIVSYAWSFGDGRTGAGVRPSHTYRHTGRYAARLVVTDANHLVSTTTYAFRVVTPEKMTALKLSRTRRGVRLTVRLSGPGTLQAGAHRYRIRRARRLTADLALSGDQKRRLAGGQQVLYRLKVVFSPQAGRTIHRIATLTL
jgi:PKD repeat protein